MITIKEVLKENEKQEICSIILRSLPNWFGIEESILEYVEGVKGLPFFTVFDSDKYIGFVSIKNHNTYTAEIYVMGVLEEYHRKGIGKIIINYLEDYLRNNKTEFLTVKTLDESRKDLYYEKTRLFYMYMGFKPLEVFPLLWDESNPCLFMVKVIS